MVVLIRAKDIESDSRTLKYISFLQENHIDYKIISWNRVNNTVYDSNTINFNYRSTYNQGGWNAVIGRIKWMIFVVKTLCRILANNNAIIHACDLDAAFPAILYKKIFNKRSKVIFDIFDWFSATLSNQNFIIRKAFLIMEWLCIKYSDYIILCEPERIDQIPYKINKDRLYILPNIPSFATADFFNIDKNLRFDNHLLTVSYVGGLYDQRCLDEIISIAEDGLINLLIAGFGDVKIEERLKSLNSKTIKYFGRVKYDQGLNIMYNADIIYAMYSKDNPNHFYAAPNKYYEAMFLGRPIISTKGINMERKIQINDMGYITEEDRQSIENCLLSISKDYLKIKGHNSSRLWVDKYKNYTRNFLENQYLKMIDNPLMKS